MPPMPNSFLVGRNKKTIEDTNDLTSTVQIYAVSGERGHPSVPPSASTQAGECKRGALRVPLAQTRMETGTCTFTKAETATHRPVGIAMARDGTSLAVLFASQQPQMGRGRPTAGFSICGSGRTRTSAHSARRAGNSVRCDSGERPDWSVRPIGLCLTKKALEPLYHEELKLLAVRADAVQEHGHADQRRLAEDGGLLSHRHW